MTKNTILCDYDAKTRRLKFLAPFFLADAMRSFPSRRFNPKDKTWRMPLVKGNINHLRETQHIYPYQLTDDAAAAIAGYEKLTAGPTYQPFPYHLYDFTKSNAKYEPMDHQRKMLDKAWNLTAASWFAKMGTGKTFAAIHLACARYQAGLIDSLVIVCPSTLRSTWRKELVKYATVDYDFKVHETKAPWLKEFYADRKSNQLQILAVSVEGLGVSSALYDSVCGFFPHREAMVIVDESSRIKNPSAQRTERTIEFRDAAKYRLILNGTPIAIGIQDLWSQYEFLDPNIIGSGDYWSFKSRYLTMGGYENKQIVGVQNIEELMKLIEPYTVEVGKDVLNLPPKLPKTRYLTVTAEQKALLRQVRTGVATTEGSVHIKVDNVLERVLRYRQIVGGWLPATDPLTEKVSLVPLKENPKMDLLFEVIADNFPGSKFIIWSSFIHEIERIADLLAITYGTDSVAKYYGATDKSERSGIEDRYCRDPSLRFLIGNPATAGLGLTFVSEMNDVMIYYSNTNAYIDRAQSEDRAHRIGQMNPVVVLDLVAEHTIDEVMVEAHNTKMSVEEYIMRRLASGAVLDLEG